MTTEEIISRAKDYVAQRHGYADWFQIDMTDMESYECDGVKAGMIDEIAVECIGMITQYYSKIL